jgi:hypothetical protein
MGYPRVRLSPFFASCRGQLKCKAKLWYEQVVDEKKAELRQYRKKLKAQEARIEPVPMTIEEDHSQAQSDKLEPIGA